MDLRQLRYIIALNDYRSFVRAADAMGITQPAFSRSIQSLEQEFGCQLVDRADKALRPTPEGEVLLAHARHLVQGAARLSSEVGQMTKLDAGRVRFGCGPSPAAAVLSQALTRFHRQRPGIQLHFVVDDWERLGRALNRDEIEFFIADIRPFEADLNFDTQPLAQRSGQFFCRPGHPLAGRSTLIAADVFAYPLACGLIPPGVRKVMANLCGKQDFTPHFQTEYFPALLRIVQESDAIGLSGQHNCADAMAQGTIERLHWRNLPPALGALRAHCGVVSRAGYRLSPGARAFIETLLAIDSEVA
ncbi:LysR family transcriptional regulator [Pseudomonas japonica]|uniref:LysR family transcriptional regulator n=1 Tax=Pseudomonas japonica TaxID=256466 RepID=UPI0015E42177|nr:LysR family transcriptional regulator [Pseudomonas japonica]MBA1291645.1 LysR family transcriptional regulator [Pseudomonas japonica]